MSDKERLEDIKRRFDYNGFILKDVKWLIEQSEKVQELERELKECYKQNNAFSVEYYEKLLPENKKLREALVFIIDIDNHPQFKGVLLEHNDYLDQLTMIEEIAKNALQ